MVDTDAWREPPGKRVLEQAWMKAVRAFLHDYEWIHTGLGLIGNTCFFVGSIFFVWDSMKAQGVWLFIWGSLGMLIGSIGSAIVRYERRARRRAAAEPGVG